MQVHTMFRRVPSGWQFKAISSQEWQTVALAQILQPLPLRAEIADPQSMKLSLDFFQQLHDRDRCQTFMQQHASLYEPLTITPICRYVNGGWIGKLSNLRIDPHEGNGQMRNQGRFWECPECGWCQEK